MLNKTFFFFSLEAGSFASSSIAFDRRDQNFTLYRTRDEFAERSSTSTVTWRSRFKRAHTKLGDSELRRGSFSFLGAPIVARRTIDRRTDRRRGELRQLEYLKPRRRALTIQPESNFEASLAICTRGHRPSLCRSRALLYTRPFSAIHERPRFS